MLHSLRLRLLLTMVAVVAVTAGTVALLAQQITISEFRRYIQLSDERSQRLGTIFSQAALLEAQGPGERQAAVARLAAEAGDRVVLSGEDGLVIADSAGEAMLGRPVSELPAGAALLIRLAPEGATVAQRDVHVIAAGGATSETASFEAAAAPAGPAMITDNLVFFTQPVSGTVVSATGAVQVAQAPMMVSWTGLAGPDPIREGFVGGVNRSIGLALVVAGLAALLLTAALSRQIIRPVEELRAAAEQMATGDLSRRVRARSGDEIAALGRAFNSMAEGLQRAEELRRHMVSDVAHELRTPLTNIRGYLEALRDGVARPSPQVIDSLHEEALLLNRLIDDLQDLALAEAGQLRLERRPTDLAAVAARAAAMARPQMQARGIECRVEAPADLPPALVDPERIGQVLRNLLDNAMRHTPAGGTVTLRVTKDEGGRVRDEDRANTAFILFSVSDTGCGIDPAELPLIFERFYRADPSRSRSTGGSGLGLTIVRRLVEAHGGSISAASEPGRGTVVSFTVGGA